MIYVFTATGNSLQVAMDIADRLHDDIELIAGNDGEIDVPAQDWVGIVTPVYFYNMPPIVKDFISRLRCASGQRFFLVFTYGTIPFGACRCAVKDFADFGLKLEKSFAVRMPENYLPMFDAPPEEESARLMDLSPEYADSIVSMLESSKRIVQNRYGPIGSLFSFFGRPTYNCIRRTKSFRVEDSCISCGLCENICPRDVIRIHEGRPSWTLDKCEHCMACIERCPVHAIQYGSRTERRRRFINDRVVLPKKLR